MREGKGKRGMPQVSGAEVVRFLEKQHGYRKVRQKGSHVIMQTELASGKSTVSVPPKKTIAKGTLNDIIGYVATRHGMNKADLLSKLGS